MLVKSLPNLMSLDISGTNLAGKGELSLSCVKLRILMSVYFFFFALSIPGTAEHSVCESLSGKKSDISGLECRVDSPLEFLGLYHTMHNACRRHDIPAKIVLIFYEQFD